MSDSASKLKWCLELSSRIITLGGDQIVDPKFHGTSSRILETSDLGLRNVLEQYTIQPINRNERKGEKVIVYTTFAKFHEYMIQVSPNYIVLP
jgi:hypothetical protein